VDAFLALEDQFDRVREEKVREEKRTVQASEACRLAPSQSAADTYPTQA
jgi:hypothetical protein